MLIFRSALLYSLGIWLSCVLVGPLVFYPAESMAGLNLGSFTQVYELSVLFGALFSFPAFLLLLGSVVYVYHRNWALEYKQYFIVGFSVLLALASVMVFLGQADARAVREISWFVLFTYSVPLIAAIFIFRFPRKKVSP